MRSYDLHVDLSRTGEPVFRSRSTIRFTCARPGASSWADALPRRVRSAVLNGRPVEYDGAGRIPLPDLAARNELTVEADYDFSTGGEGLHRFTDPADQQVYVYSHLQPGHAPRVFACFDQPDLKAPFAISVTAPDGWTVVSNAPVVPGAPLDHRPGTGAHRFAPTPPISTYVVAVAAGPWASWTVDQGGAVPLGVHSRRSLAAHLDPAVLLERLGAGVAFFAEAFATPYPFRKLDLCFVPEFNFGAMENAACVFAAETFVFDRAVTRYAHRRRDEMIFHEISHQWFGDLVTLRWWDDLWLSEAFATWAGVHALTRLTGDADAWADFAAGKKAHAYLLDQSAATHPVVTGVPDVDAAGSAFDALTYHKGASVLRQLVASLGLDGFLEGMRRYFADHSYGTAGRAEMLGALEKAGGRDLTAWTDAWLLTAGLTEVRADFDVDEAGCFTRFDLLQDGSPRPHRLAVGVYAEDRHGDLVRVRRHELDADGPRTSVAALVGARSGALVLPNDGDLTYARIVLDPRSTEEVVHGIGRLADPMARSLCWTAAWDMVRHGELPPRRFLTMVLAGLTAETQIGVFQRLLVRVSTVLTTYTEQGWARAHGWPSYVDHLLHVVSAPERDTDGDADQRLAAARAVADAALTAGHVDTVRKWFHGAAPIDVDDALRRRLARSLVAYGEPLEDVTGAFATVEDRLAERLRASVPTAEAKEWAWTTILGSRSVAQVRALADGFAHPAHHDLLTPFARRYAQDVPPLLAAAGDREPARTVAVRMFPSWSVSRRTLGMIDRLPSDDRFARLTGAARAELALAVGLSERDAAG
ncbi:aminopeptidase N [Microbispora triticiradicis]|uniref:aminopeptidase N n=1 Tax=Microbispora triticiradicis TaxID=2200763 RepID=UPI0027DB94F8|nr:aminopeptidase N [Microbispora triticiradicis]